MIEKDKLSELRDRLLDLHKALLQYQQHEFEQDNQPVVNPAALFQLVTEHQAFAWLRTLSELIVGIDVFLESEPQKQAQELSLIDYTHKLLVPDPSGNDFSQNYFVAIQKNPDITVVHGKVMELLNAFEI